MSRRRTIAEATDSVDRRHVLVERFNKNMSSRVRALEVSDNQNGDDADWCCAKCDIRNRSVMALASQILGLR